MGTYRCDDEELSYRESGDGKPVIVIPGGPGRDVDYLEELGGLDRYAARRLIVMEPCGTGGTPAPSDPARYAASSLATDLDGLRRHLGLDKIELIAHSAGCAVAFIYAARHPQRIRRLVLLTPSTRAIRLDDTDQEWEAQQAKRRHEPWFLDARSALDEIETEGPTPERRQRMSPLLYGTWDARAQKHAASDAAQRNHGRHPRVLEGRAQPGRYPRRAGSGRRSSSDPHR